MAEPLFCTVQWYRYPSGAWIWCRQLPHLPCRFLFVAVRPNGAVLGVSFYSRAAAETVLFAK